MKLLKPRIFLQILAEPNLIAVNGKKASFLAGGQFPFPIVQPGAGFTAVTISFKDFGVKLDFTPVIMPNGNIHLTVAPEVSTLDFSNALTISGFTVPALSTRKAETEFELQDGQSFVIAGLMDNRVTDINNKIPGLGDIPILGAFFRSKSAQRSHSELMVLCTVHRVSPNTEAPAPPKNPEPYMDKEKFDKPSSYDSSRDGLGTTGASLNVKGHRLLCPSFQSLSSPPTMSSAPCCRCWSTAPAWPAPCTLAPASPLAATDPVTRRVRAANPDVTLVDIPADNPPLALRAIELLHQEMPDPAVFAIGNLNQPQVIVNAMRAGAREFIERPPTTTDLLEAFVRLTAAQRRGRQEGPRGKVFSVINAKGGSGATTVAVNLALALQSAYSQTALVDMAPLGHAALHINLKPLFTVADATRNLHRMDASLLESFMTRHKGVCSCWREPTCPLRLIPPPPSLCGCSTCWSRTTVTSWSMLLRASMLAAVSSPISPNAFCWSPAPMWLRCGAPRAFSSIWEKPEVANAFGWC